MTHKLKSIITLLLGITTAASATVRTVNNIGGGQYSDIESAVVASAINDTVYICGSNTAYLPPSTRKDGITFIGTGFNVQKQSPVKSTIWPNQIFNVGNNNRLIGLVLGGSTNISFVNYTGGLTLERCFGSGVLTCINGPGGTLYNLVVNNCVWNNVLTNSNTGQIYNTLISHSMFYYSSSNVPFASFNNAGSVLVDYCTFYNYSGAANSIFGGAPAGGFTFNNSVFYNCFPGNNIGTFTYNYNMAPIALTGATNINNSAWNFVQAQGTTTTANFDFAWDFNLLPASPGHNTSADGNDRGIYGGIIPFQWDGEPAIPQIDVMTTTGTQFAPGGSMQINFQSSVQD